MNRSRGQTIPIWTLGTLTALVLMVMAMSYGSTLRWQIRAQNAADAAARGMLAVQTNQWNQTMATLHAAAVEEYRLRNLMNALLEVIQGSGGCDANRSDSGPTTCTAMYANLRQQYLDSLQRYTNDVLLLNRVSYPSQSDQIATIRAALALYQTNCGTATGGDCAFQYTVVGTQPRKDGYLEDVYSDCCAFTVGGGTAVAPKDDLSPLELEVVACANVQPLWGTIFKFASRNYSAIGRAAATSLMSSQEFMYVGSMVNTVSTKVFQPTEYPESSTGAAALGNGNDANYRIDYGGNPDNPNNTGNPATSDGKFGFVYTPKNSGILAGTGWWQTMAIKPFSGQLQAGTSFTCK